MVITSNGRPVAVLTAVNEGNVEQSLRAWRQVRATQAIADVQRQSVLNGTDRMSIDEIDEEIAQSRDDRRKRSR
jgi:antitoxin (DNA-binding transcriptional repressor) of toxin-antitoxin stability system